MTAGPLTDGDEAFLRASLAAHVVRFDSYGEPTKAKLLNNVTGAYNARALALMLTLADEQGVDVRRFYEVLLTSSGGSWMASGFMPLLDDMLAKDVHLLRDELGGLPHVDLDSDADLVASLGQARALLAGR
jgi:3-hydroxyisobutyrate dehydrogenase-like beta-hydroxyacid dehydrogenase